MYVKKRKVKLGHALWLRVASATFFVSLVLDPVLRFRAGVTNWFPRLPYPRLLQVTIHRTLRICKTSSWKDCASTAQTGIRTRTCGFMATPSATGEEKAHRNNAAWKHNSTAIDLCMLHYRVCALRTTSLIYETAYLSLKLSNFWKQYWANWLKIKARRKNWLPFIQRFLSFSSLRANLEINEKRDNGRLQCLGAWMSFIKELIERDISRFNYRNRECLWMLSFWMCLGPKEKE